MFAEELKKLRKQKNLTQSALAAVLGVSAASVAMWETAKREPDMRMLVRIANYLGVTTDRLLGNVPPAAEDPVPGLSFALWGESAELTEQQKQDVLDYLRYKKQTASPPQNDEPQNAGNDDDGYFE